GRGVRGGSMKVRMAAGALLAATGWGHDAWAQAEATADEAEPAPTVLAAPAPVKEAMPPEHRLTYANLAALRVNPLGLENRTTFGYEHRLWDDPGLLTRDAYVGLKLYPILN